MMKKTISFLLAAVLLFAVLMMPVLAEDAGGDHVIAMHLRSDLAGVKPEAYTKFAEITAGSVDFNTYTRSDPVYVADYAGTGVPDDEALKAGREYVVYYDLFPVNGYELPETKEELDMRFDCDKGVRVISYAVTRGRDDVRAVQIMAVVIVDGNIFQRVIGWLYDRYLKVKAWSLY